MKIENRKRKKKIRDIIWTSPAQQPARNQFHRRAFHPPIHTLIPSSWNETKGAEKKGNERDKRGEREPPSSSNGDVQIAVVT